MIKIDQLASGQWSVIVTETNYKYYFDTQEEAVRMTSKLDFAQNIQNFNTQLAELFKDAPDLEGVYFDRGYNGGGSDPITDSDLTGLGITAAQLGDGITLLQQLQNFAQNNAVTQGDYSATVNTLRTGV